MNAVRLFFLAVAAALFAATAIAQERIDRFDVAIDVERDGDINVTEVLEVTAQGIQIRRGIFRDLPRYFESEGARLSHEYDVLGVKRDGVVEPYQADTEDAAYRIRIGDEDVFLTPGSHTYEIRYRVRNQVRYFDRYDELYWNATGNYWAFPILVASVTVTLPPGGRVSATKGYTGALGEAGADYTYTPNEGRPTVKATRRLEAGEGLTVAVAFDKGLIDPPSGADRGWIWWQRHGALAILLASLGMLSWFYLRSFGRVGRDPPKGPVFARYDPPKGLSPAAVHHVYYRGVRGHLALIASLMNFAVKGQVRIDTSAKGLTRLERVVETYESAGFSAEETALKRTLFTRGPELLLDGTYDPVFSTAYTTFKEALSGKYGRDYFRWNAAYTIGGLVLTIAGILFAIVQDSNWSGWHTLTVIGLAALNLSFLYLMPAPTPKGQSIRTEVEGFRLYMDTAEKLQLNAVKVGSDAPPPMSQQRYETFLPYAVALGVEKPWTQYFERFLPEQAAAYTPVWTGYSGGGSHSLTNLNSALVSSMSSGVSNALPQSSSSSGSSGGGSSGGGGGGGGGGGW